MIGIDKRNKSKDIDKSIIMQHLFELERNHDLHTYQHIQSTFKLWLRDIFVIDDMYHAKNHDLLLLAASSWKRNHFELVSVWHVLIVSRFQMVLPYNSIPSGWPVLFWTLSTAGSLQVCITLLLELLRMYVCYVLTLDIAMIPL